MGRVRKIGQGLSRSVFAAEVDTSVEGWPRDLVALVPHRDAPARTPGSVEREAILVCERVLGRAVRRPFQVQLLEAYAEHSDVELRDAPHLRWPAEAISDADDKEPARAVLARLRNLLRAV